MTDPLLLLAGRDHSKLLSLAALLDVHRETLRSADGLADRVLRRCRSGSEALAILRWVRS